MKSKSFTLIELLVVISVIGLLSSIVLVSTKGIREKARIAKTLEFSQSLQNALGSEAVAIWNFDENSGTTANDSSGYGNNGTINGASFVDDTPQKTVNQGVGKYALSFNGSGYVQMGYGNPSLSEISGDKLTVEAWIKPNILSGSQYILIKNGPIIFSLSGNKLVGAVHTINISWPTVSGLTSLSTNWNYVVMTYDGNYIKLYVNGVFDNSLAAAGGNLAGDGCVQIGRYTDGGCNSGVGNYFNGLIDEVRIYSQALTIGQIQKHYVQGLANHLNLAIKQ